MPYSHQKTLIFVCTILSGLSGCAEGVTGDFEPSEAIPAAAQVSVPLGVDTGPIYTPAVVNGSAAQIPTLGTPGASSSPLTIQDAGSAPAVSTTNVSALDAAAPSSSIPAPSVPTLSGDAGTATTPSVANRIDAAVSASRDASATPVTTPVCAPLQCSNSCGLLPRCCNDQNQCACFSLLRRSCSLPSL